MEYFDSVIDNAPTCSPSIADGQIPGMATFLKQEHKLPALIAISMYEKQLPEFLYGFTLRHSSAHIAVYTRGSDAIIGLRGTNIGGSGMFRDISDDLDIAFGNGCDLAIRREAEPWVRNLAFNGHNIVLAGHSLGGRAAICLADIPGVVDVVALNAGAPITNPDTMGGAPHGTHYHIVGDIISTHVYNMPTVRIYAEREKAVDWLDAWYHSTDRFRGLEPWFLATDQEEQDDLEDFVYGRAADKLKTINLITSAVSLPWYHKARELVCERPIPGATEGKQCIDNHRKGGSFLKKGLFAFLGGALLGLLLGPEAIFTGASIGWGLADGDLSGVLGALIPGWAAATDVVKGNLMGIIEDSTGPDGLITNLRAALE